MRVQIKEFRNVNGNKELILKNKRTFFKGEKLFKNARQLTAVIEGGASCTCQTINSTTERYMLMGIKRDDKIIVKFGMLWNKKDKEFKKGFKAIHKGNTCEGIFREMVVNGETKPPSGTGTTQGAKDTGKKPSKNKKGGKNQKPPKKGKQNTKKNKKGNKEKENDKEKMKDKKGKKGKDKVKTTSGNTANRRDTMSKTELEDRALSNFMKVAN
ncbi:hypothetical protein BgiMline_024150 [Biomphalaria glabrata]|nr:frizzled-related protein 2 isoform X1 [Biomphalaria glabrata]